MTVSRRSVIVLLCPLLAFGFLVAVQGCGGGGKGSQTESQQQAKATMEEAQQPATQHAAADTVAKSVDYILGYTCPMHPEQSSLEPGTCPVCGMSLVEAHLHYICPMHPEVQATEPGKCPKCGMDLVLRPVPEAQKPID
jgi:hypothetical protein